MREGLRNFEREATLNECERDTGIAIACVCVCVFVCV